MVEQSTSELLVLGAGVIGLSCAWRTAQLGLRVTVLDPAPASGASWVAGGMLALPSTSAVLSTRLRLVLDGLLVALSLAMLSWEVVLADTAQNLLDNPLMREAYLGEL